LKSGRVAVWGWCWNGAGVGGGVGFGVGSGFRSDDEVLFNPHIAMEFLHT
jgi:hypothetical protein